MGYINDDRVINTKSSSNIHLSAIIILTKFVFQPVLLRNQFHSLFPIYRPWGSSISDLKRRPCRCRLVSDEIKRSPLANQFPSPDQPMRSGHPCDRKFHHLRISTDSPPYGATLSIVKKMPPLESSPRYSTISFSVLATSVWISSAGEFALFQGSGEGEALFFVM